MYNFSRKMTLNVTTGGFSLIELLVSISIFTMVITMAVGSLLVLVDANAKAQNMQEAMVNVTFAVDSMVREIRTGRGYYCSNSSISGVLDEFETQDCDTGGTQLSIVEGGESLTDTPGGRITYRYDSTNQSIDRRIGNGGWFPLSSSNVKITDAIFYTEDTETGINGDLGQANVSIYIEGYVGQLQSVDTTFKMQTSVVKRVLDI